MANVPQSMMVEIKDTVSIFDRVGDGKVAVNDIINVLRALDLNPGSNDWKEQINDYIKKNVERIDVDEFASIYAEEEAKKKASTKDIIEGLKAVDPQSAEHGNVSRPALMRYLTSVGDAMTIEEADAIISNCVDREGRLVIINDIVKLVMSEC